MIITVLHQCDGSWHTFTSEEVPGFYLTGQKADLEELYAEIPQVIGALAKADFGFEVDVSQVETYNSYLEKIPDSFKPEVRHYSIEKRAA